MPIYQQNPNGSWEPAKPLPPSRQIRVERWLVAHHMRPLATMLARWDERKLGR